jgi:hypothetical protein
MDGQARAPANKALHRFLRREAHHHGRRQRRTGRTGLRTGVTRSRLNRTSRPDGRIGLGLGLL